MLSRDQVFGSILHGAYGDYYEQALCIKHFKANHPNARFRLFAASESRLRELSVLDFSFAEGFTHWRTIADHHIDNFFQFQLGDEELEADVLSHLPANTQEMIRRGGKRLPWTYLRSMAPLTAKDQLSLSTEGCNRLASVMRENGITASTFERPTLGFLWRYRSNAPGSAIHPWLQPSAEILVKKYSSIFRSLIEFCDCNILICGMNVKITNENRERTDCKYPDYGLDLPKDHAIHLKGLSWPLELEILTWCDVCLVNASGFSEALYFRKPDTTVLADPPLHYKLKLLRHRMPLFKQLTPSGFFHIWGRQHSKMYLFKILSQLITPAFRRAKPRPWLAHVES